MARPPRIDFPGAWHHVMNRGARKEPTFKRDADCDLFLDLVGRTTQRFGWEVHAYALMPNHYHLLIRSADGNLSECMRSLGAEYTQRMNLRYSWDGSLFRGRFRSQLVQREGYLNHLVAYLHLNPVRARLISRPDADWWTSHRAYVGVDPAPDWLSTQLILDRFGGAKSLQERCAELHLGSAQWPPDLDLDSGWLLPGASPDHIESLPARDLHSGEPVPTDEGARMQALLQRVCVLTGAAVEDLRSSVFGPTGNPARRMAAWVLATHGRFSHRTIASELNMSTPAVAATLRRLRVGAKPLLRDWMREWNDRESSARSTETD